jgi:N6-L-threonylcarbamoyladenine synthase
MITLGLETSCDETSVALLENERVISNVIYSQVEHSIYGGVVPEIASRAHLEKIDRLALSVFEETKVSISDVDLIAVTDSPGLAGALLVGVSFGLGLHKGWNIPITGVNHLEGHIFSALIEHPELQFPFLALVVSGGHTAIYKADDVGTYTCLGQTVDDAAGEAFDKVGKMLGFAYPAGRSIELESQKTPGSAETIKFPVAKTDRLKDFSFSGLKTAVKYYLANKSDPFIIENRPMICKAFQKAVIASLVGCCRSASHETGLKKIVLVGGVACNSQLRESMKAEFGEEVYFPQPRLCTDNAAMIALCGYRHFLKNDLRFPKMNPSKGI